VVVATPGTGVIYTLAAGLARGARASIVAAAGCTLGILPHMAAAITGLAALLHTSAVTTAILINILNPKLTIFFFAFLPQFVSSGDPHGVLRMLGLSTVFMLITFVIFGIYGVFAAAVREQVLGRPRVMAWMRRAFAGSFLALGAKLAVTRQ
jgi:threonine/homoserine/homoserine lactone efflux protein